MRHLLGRATRPPVHPVAVLLVVAAAALAGCRGERIRQAASPVQTPRSETEAPASWVRPQSSPIFWSIWADVRDYLGEAEWAALDTSWMPARARVDLATVTTDGKYADAYILGGLWRLGLEKEEVLRVLARKEPTPAWPLATGNRSVDPAWRPRLERWLRAQPKDTARAELRERLDVAWREAVAAKNTSLAGVVVEATDRWVGTGEAERLRPAAQDLARESLRDLEVRGRADWRDARIGPGRLLLLERYGVPSGVDLTGIAAAARKYSRQMADESIPLPHPYGLELDVLRIERLRSRAP